MRVSSLTNEWIYVAFLIFVPLGTMCNRLMPSAGDLASIAPPDILSDGDNFHVGGVNAMSDPAKMVDDERFWNISHNMDINDTMGRFAFK